MQALDSGRLAARDVALNRSDARGIFLTPGPVALSKRRLCFGTAADLVAVMRLSLPVALVDIAAVDGNARQTVAAPAAVGCRL